MFAIRPETYLAVSVLDVGTILPECSTVPRISVRIYQVPGVQYVFGAYWQPAYNRFTVPYSSLTVPCSRFTVP